jgi:hypothetical protein
MTVQTAFDVINLFNSADLATNGTMTFNYPAGRVKTDYAQANEKMTLHGLMTDLLVGGGTFSLAYGTSSVVVTYLGATSIPNSTRVSLQLPLAKYNALVDNSGGAIAGGLAAGVGIQTVMIYLGLNDVAANGDIITNLLPGFNGKILALDWIADKPVTTGAKLATFTPKINAVNVTGGAAAITSANSTPQGVKVAGSAVTALNTFLPTDTIGIVASGVTQFTEGTGWLVLKLQNMDVANAFAALADKVNTIFTNLKAFDKFPG